MTVSADVAGRLRTAGRRMRDVSRTVVEDAALLYTEAVRDEIRRDTGDGRLSGMRGGKVGARYKLDGSRAQITATGPLHIIDRATKAHTIRPRRKRGKALRTPYGPRRAVRHPGTRGKNTWQRGIDKAQRSVRRRVERTYQQAITEAIDG